MAEKTVLVTAAGFEELKNKYEYLKDTKRQEVAARLKAAIALGDLSENSEYDDAKNEQAFLEGEIQELKFKIEHAQIIEETSADSTVVSMGNTVLLKDLEEDEEMTFQLVGSTEADPDAGKISNESPVGAAIIGKNVGEVVDVHVGENVIQYEIVNIIH